MSVHDITTLLSLKIEQQVFISVNKGADYMT